jgi:methyl-accepting chemotaxis protein
MSVSALERCQEEICRLELEKFEIVREEIRETVRMATQPVPDVHTKTINSLRADFLDYRGEFAEFKEHVGGRFDLLSTGMSEFRQEMRDFRTETNQSLAEMQDFRKETNQTLGELLEFREETNQNFAEMREFRAETNQTLAELLEFRKETNQSLEEMREFRQETNQTLQEILDRLG